MVVGVLCKECRKKRGTQAKVEVKRVKYSVQYITHRIHDKKYATEDRKDIYIFILLIMKAFPKFQHKEKIILIISVSK